MEELVASNSSISFARFFGPRRQKVSRGCVCVWFPIVWPLSRIIRVNSGYFSAFEPIKRTLRARRTPSKAQGSAELFRDPGRHRWLARLISYRSKIWLEPAQILEGLAPASPQGAPCAR